MLRKINSRNFLYYLMSLSALQGCKSKLNDSDLLLETGTVSVDLPITWKVQGERNRNAESNCGDLKVPAEIEAAIENAFAEAQNLLKGKVKRRLVLVSQTEADQYANVIAASGKAGEKPPTAHLADYSKAGGVGLIDIEALVKGERVNVFDGCIGTQKRTDEQIDNDKTIQQAQVSDTPVSKECWESSVTTAQLKKKDLKQAVNASCPPGGLSAGFGLRTNTRAIALRTKWIIKGEIIPINLDQEFDYSSIEFYAGAEADLSGFAGSVLPLPPGAKRIAGALLDNMGTIRATGETGVSKFLIPDQFSRRVKTAGTNMRKASNLAIAIARDVLAKVCEVAVDKEMEQDPKSCELDESKFIRQVESSKVIDNNYKKVPVVTCDGEFLNAVLYAKFRKPQVVANLIDQETGEPVKEKFFLENPGKTKMALWRPEGKISSALTYFGDALFLGPAQNQSKCGTFDKDKEICESFRIASHPGKGLDCNKINSKQSSVYLSFVRDSAVMNELK